MLSITETLLQHNPQLLILSSSHVNVGEDTNSQALVHAAVIKWCGLDEGAELVTVLRLSDPRHRTSRFSEDVVYASKMASDRGMECCVSLCLSVFNLGS